MSQKSPNSTEVAARRQRLRQWIADNCDGLQVKFIAACAARGHEINQGELSGLMKGKSFGEKKARSLEKMAGMPVRYLDAAVVMSPTTGTLNVGEERAIYAVDTWPFKSVTPAQYQLLSDAERHHIEAGILLCVRHHEAPEKRNHAEHSSEHPKAAFG